MITPDKIKRDIEKIKAGANNFLLEQCQIRYIISNDVIDGVEQSVWSPFVTVPCRFIVLSGSIRTNQGNVEISYQGRYRMQLLHDTYVDEGDQILYDGRLYDVDFVPPSREHSGAFIVDLKEITYD